MSATLDMVYLNCTVCAHTGDAVMKGMCVCVCVCVCARKGCCDEMYVVEVTYGMTAVY